jgi:hypothetical protein
VIPGATYAGGRSSIRIARISSSGMVIQSGDCCLSGRTGFS